MLYDKAFGSIDDQLNIAMLTSSHARENYKNGDDYNSYMKFIGSRISFKAQELAYGKAANYFIENLNIYERSINGLLYGIKWAISSNSVEEYYSSDYENSEMPMREGAWKFTFNDYLGGAKVVTGIHFGISVMMSNAAATTFDSAVIMLHSIAYGSKKHMINADDLTSHFVVDIVSNAISGYVYLGFLGSSISAGITALKYGCELFDYNNVAILVDQFQGFNMLYHIGLQKPLDIYNAGAYDKLLIILTGCQKYFYNIIDFERHYNLEAMEFQHLNSLKYEQTLREVELQNASLATEKRLYESEQRVKALEMENELFLNKHNELSEKVDDLVHKMNLVLSSDEL